METVTLDGTIVVDDLKNALKQAKKEAKKEAKKAAKKAEKNEIIKNVSQVTTTQQALQLEEEIMSDEEDDEEMIEWSHSSRPNEKLYLTGDFHVLDENEEHIGDFDAENDVIILVEE